MYKHGQKAKMYNKMKRHVCIIIRITIILQTVKLFVKLLAQTAEYERIVVVNTSLTSQRYIHVYATSKNKNQKLEHIFLFESWFNFRF